MIKTNNLKLKIEGIGTNGEGIAKNDQGTCFVPFCLVGEEVEAKPVYKKGSVINAQLVKVTKAVNGRTKPKCKVFGECGGCQLQHMSYDMQLVYKQNLVKNNLKKLGGVDVDVLPTEPSAKTYGYRNKLQMPFGKKDGKTVMGFFKPSSHDMVVTNSCPLQESWADDLCNIVKIFADEQNLTVYNEKTKQGLLRHLVARYVDNQLLVTIVVNGDTLDKWQTLAKMLEQRFDRYGLFVNLNKKHTNVILGDKTMHLCGIPHIEGDCCGVRFNLQPNSFFQINDDIRDKIYRQAISLVDTDGCDVIIDAFSGIGIMSGVLAKTGKQTFGIEIVPEAVQDADKLAKLNGLDNLTNICGDVNIKLKELCQEHKNVALVVDPPRKGLDKQTKDTILQALPKSLVYVSCNSATLARDVKDLSQAYEVTYCKPWDMFPMTNNVETLAKLTKKDWNDFQRYSQKLG